MYRGAFGTMVFMQNSLAVAASADADGAVHGTAGAARRVVIGGEGACCTSAGVSSRASRTHLPSPAPTGDDDNGVTRMLSAGSGFGTAGAPAPSVAATKRCSRHSCRYICIAVAIHLSEGPLRDPQSLKQAITMHIGEADTCSAACGGSTCTTACFTESWLLSAANNGPFPVRILHASSGAIRARLA